MTGREALEALVSGNKVRRKQWCFKEYIYLDCDSDITNEHGRDSNEFAFVLIQDIVNKSDDWEIYQEEPQYTEITRKEAWDLLGQGAVVYVRDMETRKQEMFPFYISDTGFKELHQYSNGIESGTTLHTARPVQPLISDTDNRYKFYKGEKTVPNYVPSFVEPKDCLMEKS